MPSRTEATLGGAASGAALGTAILPGWGTAIGAGLGGALGYFGSGGGGPSAEELENRARIEAIIGRGLRDTAGRAPPQARRPAAIAAERVANTQISTFPQGQFRGMEMGQAQRLAGIAGGTAKGPGELAVERQIAGALAGQQASARMARGAAAPSAGLAAARGMQEIGVTGAGLAGQQALSDRMSAEQALTGVLGQGRAADINLATSQAGLSQQANIANQQAALSAAQSNQQATLNTNLANLQARLAQTGMDDAAQLAYLSQLTGMDSTELQARIQASGQNAAIAGGLISAGGQIIAANANKSG